MGIDERHVWGPDCPVCGDGRSGTPCVHSGYSKRFVRFVKAHREAFDAAYLDGNGQAARPELERLQREYATLLPRHDCTCWPTHCIECAKMARQRVQRDTAVEIGRSSPVNASMPSPMMLDLNAGYAA